MTVPLLRVTTIGYIRPKDLDSKNAHRMSQVSIKLLPQTSLARLFELVGKLVREWMAKLRGSDFGNIWTRKEPRHVAASRSTCISSSKLSAFLLNSELSLTLTRNPARIHAPAHVV
jgi:hypothetical protein